MPHDRGDREVSIHTEWSLVAESILDQLTTHDRDLVKHAVHQAAMDWEHSEAKLLAGAWDKNMENMFVLHARNE